MSHIENGRRVEVAAIGRQGFLGASLLLDDEAPAFDVVAQIAGPAWRMSGEAFISEVARSGMLRRLTFRSVHAQLVQSGQNAACNRLHKIGGRTARWLLQCADWVGRESFELTQEYLAYVLAVRRPSVSLAASNLQRHGSITYQRRRISVIDRAALEAATCQCYAIVRDEYRRLLR